MKTLQIGNTIFNNKQAKICIPVTGNNEKEISEQAEKVVLMHPDIIEWRADYYNTEPNKGHTEYIEMLEKIHKIIGNIPLIFTFRTVGEGGEKEIDFETYASLCKAAALTSQKCNVAFIDVEAYGNQDKSKDLIDHIHYYGAKVIASNHHFEKTPSKEEMVSILKTMEELGADVCKLAVMPKEKEDVTALIEASKEADDKLKVPVITMSMGELGAVTRICTRLTGSVITFASGVSASAPGQPAADIVRKLQKQCDECSINSNIVLIGFMGTGKTTISKALSRIIGFEEVDVDKYIVENAKMEIKDIFEQYGEQYFRDLETKALKELQDRKNIIISCGGGAVLRDENVEILKESGVIVLLTASPETVFERVKDHTHRPILNSDMSIGHIVDLMSAREPRYEAVADIKINVDNNDRVMACYDIITKLESREK